VFVFLQVVLIADFMYAGKHWSVFTSDHWFPASLARPLVAQHSAEPVIEMFTEFIFDRKITEKITQ